MPDYAALHAITERIHRACHADTCADIHPAIHAQHMAGFRAKACLILERTRP